MSNEMTVDTGTPIGGLSQIERVVDTFVAPTKTFTDILRSASWWLPLLLLIISSVATAFVIDKQVGFDRVYANQLHQSPKQEDKINDMDPDQKAKVIKISAIATKVATYGSFVFILIFVAIYSLVLWGSFNFGLGAKTTYPQVFAVSMYSALPYLITAILTIVTLYFGGNADAFLSQDPVGTNPGYYMPDAAPWLKALLGSFDIVKIWSDILGIIGMSIIAKKTIAQSAAIIGSFWLLGVIALTVRGAFS